MKVSAVIFDMDGVIFDTERLGYIFWKKALEEFGYIINEEIYYETVGVNILETERIFKKYLGDIPFDEIYKRKKELIEEYIEKNGLPVKDGFFELLDFLDEKKIPRGIATSTERERAIPLLERAKILNKFDVIVCGDDVEKSKPEPDIFLLTAQRLKANPKECIVLEDSDNGVLAAKRAGMTPLLIIDFKPPHPETLKRAYKVFNSLWEVKEYLKEVI
ncbi:MAG: HAD family hydrolase [Dictyoglomus sp.]